MGDKSGDSVTPDAVAHELAALRTALAEGWIETPSENPTQAFLAKCGGWEDTRSLEEIIAEILWHAHGLPPRGVPLA